VQGLQVGTTTTIQTTPTQRAVVAELMAPTETPFGRPPLTITAAGPAGFLLLSPAEPVDEPDDE
jgi:hypothetical protein